MEAATPIMTPKQEMDASLTTTLSKYYTKYKVEIGKSKDRETLIISISLDDFDYEKSDYFYQISLSLDSIIQLGKYFRVCDNLDDVINCFNKIIESTDNNNELKITEINDKSMTLFIKTKLATGKEEKIELKLNTVQKDKDESIKDLKNYIKFLKEIPGVQKAIDKYFQQSNSINELIIENNKQIKFEKQKIEEEYNEEGLDTESIETVMSEARCSRQSAIKALRENNGDPVEAMLELLH